MENKENKQDWNRFVIENGGSFLQSWEWGEFQRVFGRRIFRFKCGDPPSSSGADFILISKLDIMVRFIFSEHVVGFGLDSNSQIRIKEIRKEIKATLVSAKI